MLEFIYYLTDGNCTVPLLHAASIGVRIVCCGFWRLESLRPTPLVPAGFLCDSYHRTQTESECDRDRRQLQGHGQMY